MSLILIRTFLRASISRLPSSSSFIRRWSQQSSLYLLFLCPYFPPRLTEPWHLHLIFYNPSSAKAITACTLSASQEHKPSSALESGHSLPMVLSSMASDHSLPVVLPNHPLRFVIPMSAFFPCSSLKVPLVYKYYYSPESEAAPPIVTPFLPGNILTL